MAVPVFLAGIVGVASKVMKVPIVAAFLSALTVEIFNFLAKFATKRIALTVALMTILTSLILSIFSAVKTLILSLPLSLPDYLIHGFNFFMPDNMGTCISVIISAKILKWAFAWQFYFLDKITG